MRRIDIDGVDPSHGARAVVTDTKDERIQVAPLLQVQTVHLVARPAKERIATGEMIREGTAKARYPRAVMETALCVQFDGAVSLEMQCLCPVIRKDLCAFLVSTSKDKL